MKKRTLLLIITFSSIVTFAQPQNPQVDPDRPVPIEGLGYLIAGGALLGMLKIIKHNRDSR